MAEAAAALRSEGEAARASLEALAAPLYTTDAAGRITWFNRAASAFAGREPTLGEDRWCVSWRLYTPDGKALPHDQCPMALAVRERRPVRGAEAIAERPDGTRRYFTPFPTPLYDEDGGFAGAVNLLFDISDRKRAEHSDQARRCRRLALTIGDNATVATLSQLAAEYDARAGELERAN